ncbi:MAG: hypothetical protein R6V84_06790 [Desulfobacterales bacterium]
MKSALKTVIVAGILSMLLPQGHAAEIEAGFMDMRWSSSATDVEGLTRVGEKEKIAYYVYRQRKYTFFGNENPADVVYGFYEDKLFAVYADIEGIDLFSQIKSYIQHKYGIPNKVSRESRSKLNSTTGLTTYIWRLNQVQIKFKHDEMSGKMKISLYYLPIAKQVNAEIEKNLEADASSPFSYVSPFPYQADAIWQQREFMNF